MKTVKFYNSTSELADAILNAEPRADWVKNNRDVKVESRYDREFYGETFEGAFELLKHGDAQTAAKIKSAAVNISSGNGGAHPRIETAITGCLPSVPNYLRGVPKQMLRIIKTPQRVPVIDVHVITGVPQSYGADEIFRAAHKIASVIKRTEESGVRVNLFAACATRGAKSDVQSIMTVKIKDAKSPLNLLNIAFPLANRAFQRIISFRWRECFSEYMFGYGASMTAKEVRDSFKLNGLVLSIRDTIDYKYTEENISDMINDEIKRAGK